MDCQGRRRRGGWHSKCHNRRCEEHVPLVIRNMSASPAQYRPWSFLSGLYSFFMLSSLMAIIYIMLEYHCLTCTAKCDMKTISQNIDDIAKNLSMIKESYHDLELKISKFAHELPKLEGQIDVLEAFTNAVDGGAFEFDWNPKTPQILPNVDVYVNRLEHGKNVSRKVDVSQNVAKPLQK